MKILFVSNLYGANARGGAERIVAEEAHALANAGHKVAVAALADASVRAGEPVQEVDGPVHILRLPSQNIFHYLDLARHGEFARLAWHVVDMCNSRVAHMLEAYIRKGHPDAVHTHNLMGLGFMIPATLRRAKIRHVHTVHDVQLLHPSGLLADERLSFAARVYVSVMRTLMGSPDVVVFPSTYLRTLHDAHGFFPRSRKVVLSNPAPPVAPDSRTFPGPRVLFVGQLEAHKGVGILLDAWKRAAADLAGAEFVIVGTGSMEAALKESAKGIARVTFTGRLAPEQVRTEMQRAAWVVVPSAVIENSPTVIAEALSVGTPVVASAIGGIPEFVQEGIDGRLVPPADADALADALRDAVKETDWTAMSDAARGASQSRGIAAHITALAALYAPSK